jgi:hypothetical protein
MANPNKVVYYDAGETFGSGSVKCIDILDNVNGIAKPSVCGSVQVETFSNDNPCGCNSGGGPCEASYISNAACDICHGMSVGDPWRIIGEGGNTPGVTCKELESMSLYALDENSCPKAQADATEFCQCTNSSVTPCVANDLTPDESKCSSNDICCDGVCQYRGPNKGLMCSTRYALSKDQWPDWALEEVPYPDNKNKYEGTTSGTTSGTTGDAVGLVAMSDTKT